MLSGWGRGGVGEGMGGGGSSGYISIRLSQVGPRRWNAATQHVLVHQPAKRQERGDGKGAEGSINRVPYGD